MQENLESVVEFLLRPRQRGLSLLDHWLRPTPAKMAPFITGADSADDSRLYSWLRVGGHGAAHRQRWQALAASAFTCGLDRTVASRWQEYVQQVLLPCRVGRKRDRVALEEWRLGPGGEPGRAGTAQEIP